MTEPSKPKNIVLFSDGTGNSSAALAKSNVWRMYEALKKSPTSDEEEVRRAQVQSEMQEELETEQVAFYDNGVGTSSFRPLMLLGGVFGFGLKRNVCDLYQFLCLHYEPGDRIFLFGFSRGAFTMRLVAALIGSQGILKIGHDKYGETDNEVHPGDVARFANLAYDEMGQLFETNGNYAIEYIFRPLGRGLSKIKQSLWHRLPQYQSVDKYVCPKNSGENSDHECVEIEFLGLFDTVSAYGGPIEELTRAFNWLFWPISPPDWNIGGYVKRVRHALALDEPRHSFRPKMINEAENPYWNNPTRTEKARKEDSGIRNFDNGFETPPALEWEVTAPKENKAEARDRLKQVWFAGAHSNIGGGYPNDGLSMISLHWMIEEAQKGRETAGDAKLEFHQERIEKYESALDSCAPLYNPRRALGGFYRYQPRKLSLLTQDYDAGVYTGTPKIHYSVFERIRDMKDYAPIAIDRPYLIIGPGGLVEDCPDEFTSSFHEEPAHESSSQLPFGSGRSWNLHIEQAWDSVWLKRVLYYFSFALGSLLILMPFLPDLGPLVWNSNDVACSGWKCFFSKPVAWLLNWLPGYFDPWKETWPANIKWLLVLGVPWMILNSWGIGLRATIDTRLSHFWQYLLRKHDATKPSPPVKQQLSLIQRLRIWPWYMNTFHVLKKYILPLAYGFLIILFILFLINQAFLFARSNLGGRVLANYCTASDVATGEFDAREPCFHIHRDQELEQNRLYRLTIAIGKDQDWKDDVIPATLSGLNYEKRKTGSAILQNLGIFLRRHITVPYFVPMLQIDNGRAEPVTELRKGKTKSFCILEVKEWDGRLATVEFVAKKSGHAFFYLNDAIAAPFYSWGQGFYRNNVGVASVRIDDIPDVDRPLVDPALERCRNGK